MLEDGIDHVESGTNLHKFDEDGPREIAAIARALNQMSETMQMAEMDRAVMLAGVSHDLRTPLTKLRLSLTMLHGADPDLLISAERQVSRIETMMAQFLEYARGFSKEQMQTVNLKSLLHEAVIISSVDTSTKIECPAEMHVVLKHSAVLRGVSNLVINASIHGIPPIEIRARRSNGILTIDVSDAGLGIAPDEVNLLIRPFARGDSARTNGGTGLGLAIVNQVALAHKGALEFKRTEERFRAILKWPE
jgi:two-component system osmolarity sensor histidine kinase EnvZ